MLAFGVGSRLFIGESTAVQVASYDEHGVQLGKGALVLETANWLPWIVARCYTPLSYDEAGLLV